MESSVSEALARALADLDPNQTDQAAVELARRYAAEIDAGGDLDKLGPQYLACLESLMMTPRSRAAKGGGHRDSGARTKLDELRQRRAARANATATLDPTAT